MASLLEASHPSSVSSFTTRSCKSSVSGLCSRIGNIFESPASRKTYPFLALFHFCALTCFQEPPAPQTSLKVGSEVPSSASTSERLSDSVSSSPSEPVDSQEIVKEIEKLFESKTAGNSSQVPFVDPSPLRADSEDLPPAEFEVHLLNCHSFYFHRDVSSRVR